MKLTFWDAVNPFAGEYAEDLTELMEYGEDLGDYLTRKAAAKT